ncbi:MAG: hypothetical protein AAGA38_03705 [Pseudomonadota bacterium]
MVEPFVSESVRLTRIETQAPSHRTTQIGNPEQNRHSRLSTPATIGYDTVEDLGQIALSPLPRRQELPQ